MSNMKQLTFAERTMVVNRRLYRLIVILMFGSMLMAACAPRFPVGDFEPDQKFGADWVRFSADGTYVIAVAPREIPGHYVVKGDQIVLNEDAGVCLNHPGTYQWKMQGKALTMTPVNDTCTGSERAKDLGGRSWILQP